MFIHHSIMVRGVFGIKCEAFCITLHFDKIKKNKKQLMRILLKALDVDFLFHTLNLPVAVE